MAEYEYKVVIGDITYSMGDLVSGDYTHPLFDTFGVGNACAAELVVKYYADSPPPRMGTVEAYYREKGTSTWLPIGTFFIDTREHYEDLYTLVCYDSMMKADAPYQDSSEEDVWPKTPTEVVNIIADAMGVSIDPRTQLNDNYAVAYPNEETGRTILGWIAAAHGGNWIITNDNKLLLVPLFSSMPVETHYLINEFGDRITFGGVRILI